MKPVVIPLFALRHRATGEFMPEMKNGKGYSHWSPGQPGGQPEYVRIRKGEMKPEIRLFQSQRGATIARSQWARGVVEWQSGGEPWDGDDNPKARDVGRAVDELELVEFVAVERCELNVTVAS